ncbi:MAG: polysaccharide biosynthesis tyrosine autokinase [Bacteroidota bacterium]|nr:polysaccharide biosynthesis tyrosine autokinase [Bacteroidota bacterium]
MENNTPDLNSSNTEIINIREILIKYLQKWHWFLISVIVCLAIAYFYLKTTNEQFDVQTTILIRKDNSKSGLLDMSMLDGLGGVSGTSKEVEDEIQLLSSKTLMTNVIKSLGIETEYYEKNGLRYDEIYPLTPLKLITPPLFNDTVKQSVLFKLKRKDAGYQIDFKSGRFSERYEVPDLNKTINTPLGAFKFQQILPIKVGDSFKIISNSTRLLTDAYCSSIKANSATKKSNAINVSTVSACPKKSEAVLDKLIELYNQDAVIDKNLIATSTAAFVQERIKLIGTELLDVEMNVENYKKKNKLTDITTDADIFLQSASEYDTKLAGLETQLNLVGYIEAYVKDNKHHYDLVPANLGIEDKSLLQLMADYNKELLERMKLLRTTNERNPVLMQMEQQLKEQRNSIIVSIASIKDGLKIAKKDVLGKTSQFNSRINGVPTQERELTEILRQKEIKSKLYLFLLQKREENALSLASTIPSAKTIDPAYSSLAPVSPKRTMIYFLALLLGIILPMVYIYVADLLNNKILDSKELKRLIKVPYLGSIGLKKDAGIVVVREGLTTPIVEMFRIIRTNIQFMLAGKEKPVILITSSISGEGKSFTAINLAMTFALLKKKVILVGLDIRSPMLGNYLHLSKEKGITIYISDESYIAEDIIVPSDLHPYLDVIPAGPVPPNPAELMMNQRLDDLFLQLREMYDYIIIDSAPIGLVSDTYLLNRLADNCVYVARQNYTPREACTLINEIYEHNKLNNMSVILNGTDESSGYGYGYGYGQRHHKTDSAEKMNLINKIRK